MIRYRQLDRAEFEAAAPQMFSILSRSMQALHPEERLTDGDFEHWLAYQSAHFSEKTFLIAEDGPQTAGYLQYSVRETELLIEEIEIAPAYQIRFGILRGFLRRLAEQLPPQAETVSAYIHRDNLRSAGIAEKLGLCPAGSSASGGSLRYAGTLSQVFERLHIHNRTLDDELLKP